MIEKHFSLLYDNAATFAEWRRLVSDLQTSGVHVHDAKLVASMMAHNIPYLVTFNTGDFSRFPMITAIDPRDI